MRISKETIKLINAELNHVSKSQKTMKKVARTLGSTQKTVGIWYKQYKNHGTVIQRVNTPVNKYSDDYNMNIINLYKQRIKLLKDRFTDNKSFAKALPTLRYFKTFYNVKASKEHIRKVLIKAGFVSFRTQRKTKSQIRKNKKKALETIKNPKITKQIMEELDIIDNVGVYRGKSGVAGFRIEVDGDFFEWFGGDQKYCLHVAVDTFTGTLLNLWMSKEETNIGYLGLLKGVFENYGIPEEGRTDKRNGLYKGKVYDAWSKLGTDIFSSSNSRFKPNVERMNELLQGIIPNLFLDWNVNNINDFVEKKEEIIKFVNKYVGREIPKDNAFQEPNKSLKYFYLKEERKVINQISHISLNNKNMAPFIDDKRLALWDSVIVFQQSNGKYFSFWNKRKCFYQEIKNILKSPNETKFDKRVELERRKGISYRHVMSNKVREINKKIEQLKAQGIDISSLNIVL